MIKKEKKFGEEKKWYKKTSYIISLIIILSIIFGLIYLKTNTTKTNINTIITKKNDFIQELSLTGTVTPAENVDLNFEISGKVEKIYTDINQQVKKGEKLIKLNGDEINAKLNQAYASLRSTEAIVEQYKAALDGQKAKLDEIKKGARKEDIDISQTNLENGERSLKDTESNLEIIEEKNKIDLDGKYENVKTALPVASEIEKNALLSLSDIQTSYFTKSNQDKYAIESAKSIAIFALFGVNDAGSWTRKFVSDLNKGLYLETQNIIDETKNDEIENMLNQMIDALKKIKTALNVVPINTKIQDVDINKLNLEKTNIDNQINILSNHKQAIKLQKTSNKNTLNNAKNAVNNAENLIETAKSTLKLKKAGSREDAIRAQAAQVKQAEASVKAQKAQISGQYAIIQSYKAQLNKTILRAPISGLITKMEAKVGEIVSPGMSNSPALVSIISDKQYQIETRVPEVDIVKIKIEDKSKVTLDAYGDEKEFEAIVTEIDPAETVIEGISTYKVTLKFIGENEKIKSGMTANIELLTDKKENIISIPQRAIIEKDKKKIVKILKGENARKIIIEERNIKTGIRNSEGKIEIIDGLNEGEKVILSMD